MQRNLRCKTMNIWLEKFFLLIFFFFNNLDNKDSLGKLSYGMGNEEKNKIL